MPESICTIIIKPIDCFTRIRINIAISRGLRSIQLNMTTYSLYFYHITVSNSDETVLNGRNKQTATTTTIFRFAFEREWDAMDLMNFYIETKPLYRLKASTHKRMHPIIYYFFSLFNLTLCCCCCWLYFFFFNFSAVCLFSPFKFCLRHRNES